MQLYQQQSQQIHALTSKELDYIADSLTNEDLLIKQYAHAAFVSGSPATQQLCSEFIHTHQQHYQALLQTLQQHVVAAPTQPQL